MTDRVGQQLGNYRLVRKLGEGGFAEVYLGEHVHLKNRQAAIKVLHTQLASTDVDSFRKEAQTVADLDHPNIVKVLDFDVVENTPFLVMDYAPNGTLRHRHPAGTALVPVTIVDYVKQVAAALQYGHTNKLVHRDVKPENMLLGKRNEVLLSDFGIALVVQSSRYQSTQEMVGTVAYMSPEQIQGHPRPASDQYSLAIVVYEWLCGDRPFHGSFTELCTQHVIAPPPPLREKIPTLPPAVELVVMTALAKDPQQRFASIQAFANALEQAILLDRPVNRAPGVAPLPLRTSTTTPVSPLPPTERAEPQSGAFSLRQSSAQTDANALYREGIIARSQGDLERTASLWQQILDSDPSYGNGTLATQTAQLLQELQPMRIQRLREQAAQANRLGDWQEEIAAWQGVLKLLPADTEAREQEPIARQNQQYAWMYNNAKQLANEGNSIAVRELLEDIWRNAPHYGDPAGLANKLELRVPLPPSYAEAKAAKARAELATQAAEQERRLQAAEENIRLQAAEQERRLQTTEENIRLQATEKKSQLRKDVGGTRAIWFYTICLLFGAGATVGSLGQPWYWAVGVVGVVALIAYIFGFRKVVPFPGMVVIAILSGALTFGLGWSTSTLALPPFDQPQISTLWVVGNRTLWLGRQIDFGLILGAICSALIILMASTNTDTDTGQFSHDFGDPILGCAILSLLPWAIVALLASWFGLGYGYGFGWNLSLIELAISMAAGAGLAFWVFLGRKLSLQKS